MELANCCLFLTLFFLPRAVCLGLTFCLIDDYSFWGTMSKYLFIFQQLPANDHFIIPNFLTYIPGMACFHYLFYFTAGKYSQFLGYFAQGIVLLSALMVLFDAEKIQVSLYRMAIAFIFLSIGFGTVFARMQVDADIHALCLQSFGCFFKSERMILIFCFFSQSCFFL